MLVLLLISSHVLLDVAAIDVAPESLTVMACVILPNAPPLV